MGGWPPFLIAALVAGAVPGGADAQGTDPAHCRHPVVGVGNVGAIADGGSFDLADGRAVRLAAVEIPAGDAARAALQSILAGRRVELRQREPTTDRYGRTVAHVYVVGEHPERNVAQDLLARGHARVAAHAGDRACAAELLALERAARGARLGLWGEPYYGIVEAGSGAELLAQQGRFTLVEGKVLSVRESGGTIYMNFGRRWSQALTVTISKRNERTFTAAGVAPKTLENRHVRVRGWVEERNGPRIEASRPEQIEIAERN